MARSTSSAVAAGALGALGALAAARELRRRPPGGERRWERVNAAGAPVTLLEGPAYVVGAAAGVALAPGLRPAVRGAGLLAVAAAGGLGAYDDLAGSGDRRGLRGHLGALRRGEVTTGAVKVLGLGATGLAAGALVRRTPLDALLAAGVVAGTANLANLLDLRPGRAIKAGVLAGAPTLVRRTGTTDAAALAGAGLGAAVAVLPDDLGARSMLGDCGANALGALLGLAAVADADRRSLAVRLAVISALTLASERVSFTAVIEATPGLRELDRLGRRAAA
jgi:UDP-GlcNAc:undecaprenyl-phosphate GlcNAc-1-phosphate transferase